MKVLALGMALARAPWAEPLKARIPASMRCSVRYRAGLAQALDA